MTHLTPTQKATKMGAALIKLEQDFADEGKKLEAFKVKTAYEMLDADTLVKLHDILTTVKGYKL
jgi:hypothetical protein